MNSKPSVMFVCVHNAGRSQMGAAYAHHLSGGKVEVRSAGSAPADSINPAVRDALLEEGIDISAEKPKILTSEAVQDSDVVITMGCGDTCLWYPGKRYEDWVLEDPAGQGVDAVRPIRDEIRRRVTALLEDLGVRCSPLPPKLTGEHIGLSHPARRDRVRTLPSARAAEHAKNSGLGTTRRRELLGPRKNDSRLGQAGIVVAEDTRFELVRA